MKLLFVQFRGNASHLVASLDRELLEERVRDRKWPGFSVGMPSAAGNDDLVPEPP